MPTYSPTIPAASAQAQQPTPGAVIQGRGAPPRRSLTMSIDTGGTFTDGFVSDGARTAQVKVDTTPQDLTRLPNEQR